MQYSRFAILVPVVFATGCIRDAALFRGETVIGAARTTDCPPAVTTTTAAGTTAAGTTSAGAAAGATAGGTAAGTPVTVGTATAAGRTDSTGASGPRVRVTTDHLTIDEKIQFASNQAVILPVSSPLLAEIATVINDHPEFKLIEVAGHASSEGNSLQNRRLSQQRASAVVIALVRRGVKRERLAANGYSSDKPIAANDNEEGREKNRRVEFVILAERSTVGGRGTTNHPPAKGASLKGRGAQ